MDKLSQTKELEVYSPFFLSIYDFIILRVICPLVWGCAKSHISKLYTNYITDQHLDIGVGTGYFLDQCQFPTENPNITLLDINESCLNYTAERIKRFHPECHQADIFQKIPFEKKFQSISLTLLLHCLTGNIHEKGTIFEKIKLMLNPGGIIFGATVLGKNVELNWVARKLLKIYNRHRIFCNLEDDQDGLVSVLQKHFDNVVVEVQGGIALFVAGSNKANLETQAQIQPKPQS